jgi:NAD(P)-dependent dehydrogenase (short-subunit alcohol dehydrogenase family)
VIGLTRAAALEVARDKIRVNAIVPGPIATESWLARVEQIPGLIERIAAAVPLGRVGTKADITSLVVFLASDAASFITGAAIPIDGGKTAGVAARREEG